MSKNLCDLVPPAAIEGSRLKEIEGLLCEASAAAERHYKGSSARSMSDFFAEFIRAHRQGQSVFANGVSIPSEDAEKMVRVKSLESELLSGFSRMIDQLVRRAASKYRRDCEDLVGEAYGAFFDAMILYNGRARFSTFLHKCVGRRLSRACSDSSTIRVPQKVRRATMRVVDRMQRSGVSFDEAVESEGIPPGKVSGLVAAMTRVSSATELDIRESEMASSEDRHMPRGVMKIVDDTRLTPLERAVTRGFMNSPAGRMCLGEGCGGMLNPSTGRPYSRAAMSAAWRQARKKLAKALKDVA